MSPTTVDLTVMYALHDAFRRDLDTLTRAAAALGDDPDAHERLRIGWSVLADQLHHHHTVEDDQLWPLVRRSWQGSPTVLDVLDAVEEEHELVDPPSPRSARPSRPAPRRPTPSTGCTRSCASTSPTRRPRRCR
jgi:hypothetical protein